MTLRTAKRIVVFALLISCMQIVNFAIEGDAVQTVVNCGATLLLVFCYFNPQLLLIKEMKEFDEHYPNLVEKKFLYGSILIGLLLLASPFIPN